MDSSEATLNPEKIDWQSADNVVLLNPRWSKEEAGSLFEVATSIIQRRHLQGHIWLATSGSTSESAGFIKLVAQNKKSFLASAKSVNQHLQVSKEDVWLQILPRFHVGGLGVEVRATLSGSQVVRDLEKWEPRRIHQRISDHQVTIASMVPTQVFDLVRAGLRSPPSLRAVIVGGGALNGGLYQESRELGWPLLPSYGLTETCSQIATAPLTSLQAKEMPWPQKLSHAEWRLSPEGLLQVRAESLFTCYGQRQKDGRIRDWDPKEDGWFTTEDFVDLQGSQIRFVGRMNDFIKIGGEATSLGRLREIFDRILATTAPSIESQVFLLDAPSDRMGSEIHLVTTLNNQSELTSRVQDSFNREVLPFERIRQVRYTQKIPRSELGKILWTQLKKELYGS